MTTGRVDSEINDVDHGGVGGKLEGMINLPLGDHIAFRAVGFYEHTLAISTTCSARSLCVEIQLTIPAGRSTAASTTASISTTANISKTISTPSTHMAAERRSRSISTTIGQFFPQFMYQKAVAHGVWFMDADEPDLDTVRYQPEIAKDSFWQAALTVEGKIADFFDLTYAGA